MTWTYWPTMIDLVVGDYLEVFVRQGSGVSLFLGAGAQYEMLRPGDLDLEVNIRW